MTPHVATIASVLSDKSLYILLSALCS